MLKLDRNRAAGRLGTLAILMMSCVAMPVGAQDAMATNVTPEQLLNAAEDGANWLMYNRTYDGHRFAPQTEINKDTVKGLRVAYALPLAPPTTGTGNYKYTALEGTPIVLDGHMFVTDGNGRVYKLDLTSGKRAVIEWIMDPENEAVPTMVEPQNNKGVAILGNMVYSLTSDGRLVATDADTGEETWEVVVQDDPKQGFTMAPLAIGENILIGSANGDTGGRHFFEARSAKDGAPVWKVYTSPAPGEPGSDSWQDDQNNYLNAGASPWSTPTYDPETGIVYWGTGNPWPNYNPAKRPGDNLYTNSVMAVNAASGTLDWYFQYTPNDSWDYDEVGAHILVDAEMDGATKKLVTHFGRNGFYYTLDRTDGTFLKGEQYVDKVTWTKGLDPKTGKPVEYDPALGVQTYIPDVRPGGGSEACPAIQGGVNYFPVSYSETTRMLYASAIEGCSVVATTGTKLGDTAAGSVVQLDPTTGKIVNKRATGYIPYGGTLSTAGGLVFASQVDGTFAAMDADTLDVLWSINLGSQITAPPISYEVNGKQYVALMVGASPIIDLLGYNAKSGDPDAAANMQPSAMIYFFAL